MTMDPKETFEQFLAHLESDDFEEAEQSAKSLAIWFRRGGFVPTMKSEDLDFLFSWLAKAVNEKYQNYCNRRGE